MLILVRHGRTAANASGRLQGRVDLPLDEVGVLQAAGVAQAVDGVSRVISSPLVRARQTAAAFRVPVEIDERWIEIDYGIYDNCDTFDVPDEVWARWRNNPRFCPEGGESLEDVARRVVPACEALYEESTTSDIAVVTHVSPIKAAVAWALGAGLEIAWRSQLSHGAVCRITQGTIGPVLLSFNETLAPSAAPGSQAAEAVQPRQSST